MRIDCQREILERDVTVIRCVHAHILQRQRAGTAAGNGQCLAVKSKTTCFRDVLQQVDLIAFRRRIDRALQSCVARAANLALVCGAACAAGVAHRGSVLLFLVLRFLVPLFPVKRQCVWGRGIYRRQAICCFIVVRIRKGFP